MPKIPDQPLRASQHCRHYSYNLEDKAVLGGVPGPCCAKGIDLSAPGSARVCMPRSLRSTDGKSCTKRREYTSEEHEAWKVWAAASLQRMVLIMAAIPGNSQDKKFRGKTGTLLCPACDGGTVRWTRASSNGHLWAACSTPHCFGIMQ